MKEKYTFVYYYDYPNDEKVGYAYIGVVGYRPHHEPNIRILISATTNTFTDSSGNILYMNDVGNVKYEDGELKLLMRDGNWMTITISHRSHAKILALKLRGLIL